MIIGILIHLIFISLQKNHTTFKELPFVIIGIFSLLATLVTYFVPETHNKRLHDTIEEMEYSADRNDEETVPLDDKKTGETHDAEC